MQYRNGISILGLGCMRFPPMGGEAERMIVSAVENGVNFFDTAYIYPGSEKTLGAALAKHNLREKVLVATKLPISMCKRYEDFDRFFDEQLRRLQTDYIDYYFIHNISNMPQWQFMLDLGIEKWLAEKKAMGAIRQVGFSYHGSGEEFPRVLDSYAWEFCMIQYNYYDENYQAGRKGLQAAAAKGLTVIIMEPLLGGKLATGLPKKAAEIFREANNASANVSVNEVTGENSTTDSEGAATYTDEKKPAEWALQWLWNHPEITCALSGTSSVKYLEENIASAQRFAPLTPAEQAVYPRVIAEFHKSFKIKCTGCNYCLPCPVGIDIPTRLSAYNARYAQGRITGMMMYMTSMGAVSRNPISIHLCNGCGACEKKCPQGLEIRKELKRVGRKYENFFMRGIIRVLRFFMR